MDKQKAIDILRYVTKTETGCRLWLGKRAPYNYGSIRFEKKSWMAHRLAYTAYVGEIPKGMICLHTCDNPLCVNPAHLRLGTQSENNRDCVAKGRHAQASATHCKRGHEFNSENTRTLPSGYRQCRVCGRDKDKNRGSSPRNYDPKVECKHGHIRTPENTYKEPNGGVKCRICMRERLNRRRVKVLKATPDAGGTISVREHHHKVSLIDTQQPQPTPPAVVTPAAPSWAAKLEQQRLEILNRPKPITSFGTHRQD